MSQREFWIYLLGINTTIAAALFLAKEIDYVASYPELIILGISVFNTLNIVVFLLAKKYSRLSDDKSYMKLIFVNFLVKFLLVVGIPLVYYFIKQPMHSYFVVPFIFVYLIFTIFETWFLNKTAIMRR